MAPKKNNGFDMAALAEAIHRLHADTDPENLLTEAAALARRIVRADEASLLLVDASGKILVEHVMAGRKLNPTRFRMRIGAEGITGWVAARKKTAIVTDVRKDSRYVQADSKVRSEAAAPILDGDRLVGVLNFESRKLNFFKPEDIPLLEFLAMQIGLGLHIAGVTKRAETLRSRLELLHHLARLGNGFLAPDKFLERIVDSLRRAFSNTYVGVFLGNYAKQEMVVLAQSSSRPVDIKVGSTQKFGHGLLGMTLKLGETVYVRDVTKDPIYIAKVPGVRSELCVPMRIGDHCLGVLDLQSVEVGAFSADDVVTTETIGHALVATAQTLSNQFAAKQHPLSKPS